VKLDGPCPVCKGELSSFHLSAGFLYCMEGHVVTLAPIYQIDLRWLRDLQQTLKARKREARMRRR
jgi:hypothetical protein